MEGRGEIAAEVAWAEKRRLGMRNPSLARVSILCGFWGGWTGIAPGGRAWELGGVGVEGAVLVGAAGEGDAAVGADGTDPGEDVGVRAEGADPMEDLSDEVGGVGLW